MRDRSVWVKISVYFAALGGQSFDYLAYVSFLRDKRWGRSNMGPASTQELERIAEHRDHPARIWVRAAVVDTVASFGMIVLIAGAFAILGAVILQPQQLVPDGVNLLNYQADFLAVLSPRLLPLYQMAVFLPFLAVCALVQNWPTGLFTSTWPRFTGAIGRYANYDGPSSSGRCARDWLFCG